MLDEIAKILSEQLGIPQSKVTLESRIVEDLGADSLEVVDMLMAIEENFGITVSDEEALSLQPEIQARRIFVLSRRFCRTTDRRFFRSFAPALIPCKSHRTDRAQFNSRKA